MDIVCLGEALIDFVALETGVSVGAASGFVKAPGGAPANVAVGAARLGGRSAFLGKVGDDPFGLFLRDIFAASGVDVQGIRFDPEARTGLAFVSLQADGERSFAFFRNPSADMRFTPEEVDHALIRSAKVFHFGTITLIDEPARSATLAAVETARQAGGIISCDPNLRPALWPDLETARRAMRETVPLAHVLKVSEEELAFLTGETDMEAGMRQVMRGNLRLRLLAVTRGAAGCRWVTASGKSGALPGYPVTAVDTTGAGDGFVAGLLLQLARSVPSLETFCDLSAGQVEQAFRYANAVGALTTTKKGAIPAMPTAGEVDAFLVAMP